MKVIKIDLVDAINFGILDELKEHAIGSDHPNMKELGIDPHVVHYLKGVFYVEADTEYATILLLKHPNLTVTDLVKSNLTF